MCGRRRFGPQGWSRAYSYNDGDLTICGLVLFLYLDMNPEVPWQDLRYLFGEIMYGGHVTDPWDRVQLNSYLKVRTCTGAANPHPLVWSLRSFNDPKPRAHVRD